MLNLDKRWTLIVVYILAFVLSLKGYVLAENLLDAVNEGNLEKVSRMVEEGSNVNIRNNMGVTPLHFAAYRGDKNIAEFLILKGADVNSLTESGRTPLHMACYNSDANCAKILILNGADVNAVDEDGLTSLSWASGHKVIAEMLIKHGGHK